MVGSRQSDPTRMCNRFQLKFKSPNVCAKVTFLIEIYSRQWFGSRQSDPTRMCNRFQLKLLKLNTYFT